MQKKKLKGLSNLFSLNEFFTNSILSASTVGSMLMGLVASLVGVLVFVRKRALIGETLSHAAYPGIVLGISLFSFLFDQSPMSFPLVVLLGAFFSGILGLFLVHFLEKRLLLNSDTALCFVLSTFLGIGVLIASRLQFSEPIWYQKVGALLYGQTATMLWVHVYIYAVLSGLILLFIVWNHSALKVINFDHDFAKMNGFAIKRLEGATIVLIVLAIVIGIRSVGVILMAGMLIAPAVCARQYANKFWQMFVVSSLFGVGIGFFGLVLSVNGSIWLSAKYGGKLALPAGPVIMILAVFVTLMTLIFSLKRSLVSRVIRRNSFRMNCLEENILKYIFKSKGPVSFKDLKEVFHLNRPVLWVVMQMMKLKKIIEANHGYVLTDLGKRKAKRIIRLHRLWEVYLFTCLDVQAEDVHKSAEEMEHAITPELEEKLVKLLGDPKTDPHKQPIPDSDG